MFSAKRFFVLYFNVYTRGPHAKPFIEVLIEFVSDEMNIKIQFPNANVLGSSVWFSVKRRFSTRPLLPCTRPRPARRMT